MDAVKIGLVVADEQEFVPVRALADRCGAPQGELYGCETRRFVFTRENRALEVTAVLCGIGKVNAAASAAFLIAQGARYLISAGLSGGISGVSRGDIVAPTRLLEHDFDLTPLGYAPAEKPQPVYIYEPDADLAAVFERRFPFIRRGVMVSGDGFVCSDAHRALLRERFDAQSCDMETAAVASVCARAGAGFYALRRISDDAGGGAAQSYTQMNDKAEAALTDLVFEGLDAMLDDARFFV